MERSGEGGRFFHGYDMKQENESDEWKNEQNFVCRQILCDEF